MDKLTINEMYEYQKALQDKYQVQWGEPICPEMSIHKLLWAYGEMAEAGDIIKKNPMEKIMTDPELRRHIMEELGDTMMYMFDVMLCLGMTPDEFSEIYRAKCERNKNRW
jgi:NTP pyrophosphatase (non-canonical NTP hydrolase)